MFTVNIYSHVLTNNDLEGGHSGEVERVENEGFASLKEVATFLKSVRLELYLETWANPGQRNPWLDEPLNQRPDGKYEYKSVHVKCTETESLNISQQIELSELIGVPLRLSQREIDRLLQSEKASKKPTSKRVLT